MEINKSFYIFLLKVLFSSKETFLSEKNALLSLDVTLETIVVFPL